MNKILVLSLCAVVVTALFSGCYVNVDTSLDANDAFSKEKIYGSSKMITISKDYKNFKAAEFYNQAEVKFIKSSRYLVTIKLNDNLLEYLESYQTGNKVVIGLKSDYSYQNIDLSISIESPDVENISLTGASSLDISGFDLQHQLAISSTGASSITGNINVEELVVNLSGASFLNLQGSAGEMYLNASGASQLKLLSFLSDYADIELSGASLAYVNVKNKIDVTLSGASVFQYKGNPQFGRLNVSGGSVVQKIN